MPPQVPGSGPKQDTADCPISGGALQPVECCAGIHATEQSVIAPRGRQRGGDARLKPCHRRQTRSGVLRC